MMQAGESVFVRELRVERIVIVRDGKTVMEIGSNVNGGEIVIYSSSGTPAIEISVVEDSGWIRVIAYSGNTAVEISADDDNNGYILFYDEREKPQMGIGVTREGVWDVLISDEAMKKLDDLMKRWQR